MAATEGPWTTRFARAVRHPVQWMNEMTGDGPLYALIVLFGLNAVDELDRSAFGILAPDIAADFGIGLSGITVVVFLAYASALALTVPIASWADRTNRVRLALLGGVVLAFFSVGIGLAVTAWMLGVTLAGAQIGKAVIDPTHNALLADYYPMELRPRIYSFHRAANSVGQFVGPISAGLLATWFTWRAPFVLFAIPTLVFVVMGLRLVDPTRGARERRAMGASEDAIETEEEPPSFAEAWRMCWQIDSLRRIYRTLPFLAPALAGFLLFASFYYEEVFGLDAAQRGFVGSATEPFQLVGLIVGAKLGMKMFAKDPALLFRFLSYVVFFVSAGAAVFALAPNIVVAIIANIAISSSLAFLLPGIFAALSLAIPARARSMGFSMGSVFVLPGLALIPFIGLIGEAYGLRVGMLAMVPMFLFGGLAIASAGKFIQRDITNVWTTSAARSEVASLRRQGKSKLLLVRDLDVSYGDVQVLFGVNFEIDEGEVVALLGTNGAGKSTLLRAISGVVEANKGAVIFDGRDMTHAPPNEIAARGVLQVPGGQGVFPSLTVAENLRIASWLNRRDSDAVAAGVAEVFAEFPVLGERSNDPAANLSGGQQQMLALGMAFLNKPRLLMIDELSLGLAPVVVEQLLPIIGRMSEQGTTVILVEQSVNVALTVAHEAYFMEKGEIRFNGPTAELLDRPDVLRSVFLEGAESGMRARSESESKGEGDTVDRAAEADALASEEPADSPASTVRVTSAAVATPTDSEATPANSEVRAAGSEVPSPALEVIGASRRFGGIVAVDDVHLQVASHEVLGIIGPNGAGKTTLFDLISGYQPMDSGRLLLDGADVTDRNASARARLGLGRSFQDARLFPSLTVEETIKVALDRWTEVRDPLLAALHLPAVFDSEQAVQTRVDELIELLGLGSFRTKFVSELSTGSRRIVDLACIVAHRPSVVLLDEPSSGIAQRETEALGPVILRIRDELGASVLIIEHDMPLVTGVSDRLLALDQGAVVTEGAPDEVLHHERVVASYLGTTDEVISRSGARSGDPTEP